MDILLLYFSKVSLKIWKKFPHTSIWLCTLQSQLITDVLCWVPKDYFCETYHNVSKSHQVSQYSGGYSNTKVATNNNMWTWLWKMNLSHEDHLGIPRWCSGKECACSAGVTRDTGSIPGSGRSPGGGHDNPLQYSCLENPLARGAWQAMVHRVAKRWTQLNWLHTQGQLGFLSL